MRRTTHDGQPITYPACERHWNDYMYGSSETVYVPRTDGLRDGTEDMPGPAHNDPDGEDEA
jgi:hypothetical protein